MTQAGKNRHVMLARIRYHSQRQFACGLRFPPSEACYPGACLTGGHSPRSLQDWQATSDMLWSQASRVYKETTSGAEQ